MRGFSLPAEARSNVFYESIRAKRFILSIHQLHHGCRVHPMSRGRHARMMADPLVEKLRGEPFTWGSGHGVRMKRLDRLRRCSLHRGRDEAAGKALAWCIGRLGIRQGPDSCPSPRRIPDTRTQRGSGFRRRDFGWNASPSEGCRRSEMIGKGFDCARLSHLGLNRSTRDPPPSRLLEYIPIAVPGEPKLGGRTPISRSPRPGRPTFCPTAKPLRSQSQTGCS
jgi:hypothetical protein